MSILILLLTFVRSSFKSQRQFELENLALRQQVTTLRQSVKHCSSSTASPGIKAPNNPTHSTNPTPGSFPNPFQHITGVEYQVRRVPASWAALSAASKTAPRGAQLMISGGRLGAGIYGACKYSSADSTNFDQFTWQYRFLTTRATRPRVPRRFPRDVPRPP
jgi:hypothetical protein